jgi:hypothetical protein
LKNNNWEAEFIQLEKTIGQDLRQLPTVNPDEEFKERLKQQLGVNKAQTFTRRSRVRRNKRPWFRVGAVAAALLMALVLVRFSLVPQSDAELPTIGPFLVPTVQASPGGSSSLLSSSGLDQMRQVEFVVQGTLPSLPDKAMALKYTDSSWTADKMIDLAAKLGLENPKQIGKTEELALGPALIEADNGLLYVWANQSSWLLETQQGLAVLGSMENETDIKKAIRQWLQQADLLPPEENLEFLVRPTETGLDTGWVVTICPASGPEGKPIVGRGPEISAEVSSAGQLLYVSYVWPHGGEEIDLPVSDFEQALAALARGEGTIEIAKYQSLTSGTATVTQAEQGYQLVYPLNDTPYLIPVAIFSGQYTSNESTADFTAWVSLLPPYTNNNSGNFLLETQLPTYKKTLPLLQERDCSVSEAELPIIAAHFGLDPSNREDGEIVGDGQTLSVTSWDGGWMYRGPGLLKGQRRAAAKLPPEEALAMASDVVRRLPNLPGLIGEGRVLPGDENESFNWVTFPLLYEDQPVITSNSPGFISRVSVQLGPDGDVWSVHLAYPMEALAEQVELISAEEAWDKLQQNDFLISLDESWGLIPGDRFAAAYSQVEKVELVYSPRYYQVVRNEHYDIKYAFSGTTQIGNWQMKFTALVDAVQAVD